MRCSQHHMEVSVFTYLILICLFYRLYSGCVNRFTVVACIWSFGIPDEINIGPVKGFSVMKEIYGGFGKTCSASVIEYKNFRWDMNNFIGERDTQVAINSLVKDIKPAEILIHAPTNVRNKGYQSNKRFRSSVDLSRPKASIVLRKCNTCGARQKGHDSKKGHQKYVIRDKQEDKIVNGVPIESRYEVEIDLSDITTSCSCRRFESYGLLCRHIFYVLRLCDINDFPKKYMLKRWSKNAVPHRSTDRNMHLQAMGDKNKLAEIAIREIYDSVEMSINSLVKDIEKFHVYRDTLLDLKSEAISNTQSCANLKKNEFFASLLGVTEPEEILIHAPTNVHNKGDRSNKRFKSPIEFARPKASTVLRKCNTCGAREKGHDTRTCPKKQGKSRKKK
ncbi:FAR1 DNA binding domain, Zinc finger, SWIM-type, MULE transposase domain, FHY3/FAR1 family [Artemisia annua]|uniref:FAR1 DNA binding domain, Zinc finger, SWIM-type, MULE transposase domain, FHY3/FAR1 family n=1 Tax=Artemisia annua TaxID=35608 RepID=A0A2U1KAH8_ARTAN|nr:FAR1 DNA binding domain, Zinc finger, SWIM-type, MULE transposase domain, FHY3/FAR1 family [Artemisia annua]